MSSIFDYLKHHEDTHKVNEILMDTLEEWASYIKQSNPKMCKRLMNKLYIRCYGEHFTEELALKAVKNMKNADGTEGEYWSISKIEDVINQYNIKCDDYNKWDLYFTMNMFHSDYCKVLGQDVNTYVKMCKAWFDDVDVPKGKSYRYYMGVVKNK